MLFRLILAVCVFSLISCGSDSEDTGGNANAEPVSVNSVTGTTTMSGVWVSGCLLSGADGVIQTYSFNGATLTSTIDTYANDISCNIVPTSESSNLSLTANGDQTLVWFGSVPTGLNNTVIGTRITQSILTISTKFAFFVDDVSVPHKLYLATIASAALDGEGYPTQLLGEAPYTKQ